jgi:hypothetical protein
MDITILIERDGIRAQATVQSLGVTRILSVHRIRWYGTKTKTHHGEYYNLTHLPTGRALSKVPLTWDESELLIDILVEDDRVQWDSIMDGRTAVRYYAAHLSPEAEAMTGGY